MVIFMSVAGSDDQASVSTIDFPEDSATSEHCVLADPDSDGGLLLCRHGNFVTAYFTQGLGGNCGHP